MAAATTAPLVYNPSDFTADAIFALTELTSTYLVIGFAVGGVLEPDPLPESPLEPLLGSSSLAGGL